MIQELHYTSVASGLKPGTRGFCTVACTQGLPPALAERLEALSGYRQVFSPQDPRVGDNPVVFSHLRWSSGGQSYSIVSRICNADLDYTNRTNKYAHHVALDAGERPLGGPAWLMTEPGFMQPAWNGEPRVLPAGRRAPAGDHAGGVCHQWARQTGDAGWAGVVAESFLADPKRPVYLIFDAPGTEVLELFAEALALIPAERRWEVSFSTYFTGLPAGMDCVWRGVLRDSTEARQARSYPEALIIDLAQAGRAEGRALVEQARTGVRPATAPTPVRPAAAAPMITRATHALDEPLTAVSVPSRAPEKPVAPAPPPPPIFTPLPATRQLKPQPKPLQPVPRSHVPVYLALGGGLLLGLVGGVLITFLVLHVQDLRPGSALTKNDPDPSAAVRGSEHETEEAPTGTAENKPLAEVAESHPSNRESSESLETFYRWLFPKNTQEEHEVEAARERERQKELAHQKEQKKRAREQARREEERERVARGQEHANAQEHAKGQAIREFEILLPDQQTPGNPNLQIPDGRISTSLPDDMQLPIKAMALLGYEDHEILSLLTFNNQENKLIPSQTPEGGLIVQGASSTHQIHGTIGTFSIDNEQKRVEFNWNRNQPIWAQVGKALPDCILELVPTNGPAQHFFLRQVLRFPRLDPLQKHVEVESERTTTWRAFIPISGIEVKGNVISLTDSTRKVRLSGCHFMIPGQEQPFALLPVPDPTSLTGKAVKPNRLEGSLTPRVKVTAKFISPQKKTPGIEGERKTPGIEVEISPSLSQLEKENLLVKKPMDAALERPAPDDGDSAPKSQLDESIARIKSLIACQIRLELTVHVGPHDYRLPVLTSTRGEQQ